MPLDHMVGPDMGELYYAAVRALKYCEPSSQHSECSRDGFLNVGRPAFSRRKHFQRRTAFCGWLRRLLWCA